MPDLHFRHMQRRAILADDLEAMRGLLQSGMSPNFREAKQYWEPVLVHAARCGRLAICKLLIEAGADVNACNHNGIRAIDFAARADDVALFKLLLSFGAKTDARTGDCASTLHEAAGASSLRCARLLLELGMPVDACDNQGRTPLFWSACTKGSEMEKLLLSAGADPNAVSSQQLTPFHKVVSIASNSRSAKGVSPL